VHLKSLVLKGFKSFADRSVLGFEPGITAVVGPNGSGKSNISDSVLWVLGERNAKNLRGHTMEDVIFAGSSARRSVGVAEVDLILDNSDATLPVDFEEVAITRRMYRNGESEYLINGALARRMDVLDILHDTGLGTGTHSIISQGNLEAILQSKPEDRRALVEEAAGVLKHKQRKMKSERKLEQMDRHLTRVRDVTAEVERQLKPLERKAKRAQSYQGLAAELAELNLMLAVDDLRVLQSKWGEVGEQEKALSDELVGARALIKQTEDGMQALQEQVQKRSVNAGDLARQYRRAQSAFERFDAASLLLHEKRRIAQAYEADTRQSLEANAGKAKSAQHERAQAAGQLEQTAAKRAEAEEAVSRLQGRQAQNLAQRSGLEKDLEDFLAQERRISQEMEACRAARAASQDRLATSKVQEKLLADRSLELEAQAARARADLEAGSQVLEEQKEALDALAQREAAAREQAAQSLAGCDEAGKAQESLRAEVAAALAEIKGLEEVERASQATNEARAWLLDHRADLASELEPLSDKIRAPKDLETLVEAFLGPDLGALCVHDMKGAYRIAEALCARDETGGVVLVPRSGMVRATGEVHATGTALVSLLDYPREAASTVEALLGDVYLCDTASEALAAHAAHDARFRFATRDGFMAWGNGRITLFRGVEGNEGSLARSRRLAVLRESHSSMTAALEQAGADKAAADEAHQAAQAASLSLSQELAQAQGAYQAARDERVRLEEGLAALQHEAAALQAQRQEALKVLGDAEPTSVHQDNQLKELGASLEEVKARSLAAQREAIPLREAVKACDDELAAARLEAATLAERDGYARRTLASKEQEIRSLGIADTVARETLAKKLVAQGRIEPLLAVFAALAERVGAVLAQLEAATEQEQDTSSGLHASITEARTRARSAHESFDGINERLSEARVEKGRLEIQVEAAISTIVNDCKTPLETALSGDALEDRGAVESQAFKLRRRIANMGTINPDAAVEYEDLKRRFDYMAGQLEDMSAARRSLAKIIRVIDVRMKDDFIQTFEQVNENFKEIFSNLFPGGAAELKLVDPADLEHTGIEVTAQPRGKRITKMMLMSGGEKSLTALALLFAVYRIRSTPFYILDEVEAALDDTNLRRICAYFDSLRETTQLILITHQRRTMEIADVLYGVTMQADGVTQVVSQRLDRALQYAED
jgi:chromosome segregation protein